MSPSLARTSDRTALTSLLGVPADAALTLAKHDWFGAGAAPDSRAAGAELASALQRAVVDDDRYVSAT